MMFYVFARPQLDVGNQCGMVTDVTFLGNENVIPDCDMRTDEYVIAYDVVR
jgi:hypothetical protein